MWFVPMQTASYKGVVFDVVTINDSADRAVVEHAYPYVNGADLEDMGLNAKQVQLQAIFNGNGYFTDLKKLLSVMQKRGAGVLVHPILGRMPNMLCVSYSITHDAENVNYCSLDLTFKEATEAEPIFVFESAVVSRIDRLVSQIEALFNQGSDFWNTVMNGISAGANWKARMLSIWGGLYTTFESLRSLFDLDKKKYALSSHASYSDYYQQSGKAMQQIREMMSLGIESASARSALMLSVRLRHIQDAVDSIKTHAKKALGDNKLKVVKTAQSVERDMAEVHLVLGVMCVAALAESVVKLVEQEQENITGGELEALNYMVRSEVLSLINAIRQVQTRKQTENPIRGELKPNSLPDTARNGVSLSSQYREQERQPQQDKNAERNEIKTSMTDENLAVLVITLRRLAHDFTKLITSVMNKKHPLVVKICPLNGSMQMVAHAFYGDYTRAEELLQLNPQIRLPNFMQEGELLNAYAE